MLTALVVASGVVAFVTWIMFLTGASDGYGDANWRIWGFWTALVVFIVAGVTSLAH